ncbi:hypothetical protein AX16_007959 [Volvariella volvacea WC 439]|nr:hypothetical protein AX16_007959 [Volvariella volvacea WC 439]
MKLGKALSLLASASLALAVPHPGSNHTLAGRRPGRGCGSTITPEEFARVESQFRQNARPIANNLRPEDWPQAEIEVYWHVVVANETYAGGWIPREQLAQQIQVLNEDYADARLSFRGVLVTRIISPVWFNEIIHSVVDTTLQDSLKRKYRQGDASTLNIYTVGFVDDDTLGYATFPHDYSVKPYDDGIVLRYTTLPGGTLAPYDLGKTLTHEVGHWLGLYHTFQGGCQEPGDGVDDTPPQLIETTGCPIGRNKDTCPGDGPDAIHNYMDYSDDECLTEFSPGQIDRLRTHIAYYRGIGVPTS